MGKRAEIEGDVLGTFRISSKKAVIFASKDGLLYRVYAANRGRTKLISGNTAPDRIMHAVCLLKKHKPLAVSIENCKLTHGRQSEVQMAVCAKSFSGSSRYTCMAMAIAITRGVTAQLQKRQ